MLPRFIVARSEASRSHETHGSRSQFLATLAYAGVVVVLSLGPVRNLMSSQQAMNTSFDKLHLVNTYGAFGSIDRERLELVFEGSQDVTPGFMADWKEYEFKAKPTDPKRRPVIITPYHYRLDWAAWFPWTQAPGRNAWLPHFLWNLLHNDAGTLSLLAGNPFPEAPPKWVRVTVYRYTFAPLGNSEGIWWKREKVGDYIPPMAADNAQLLRIVNESGWLRE